MKGVRSITEKNKTKRIKNSNVFKLVLYRGMEYRHMQQVTLSCKTGILGLLFVIMLIASAVPATAEITQEDGVWIDGFENTGFIDELTHCQRNPDNTITLEVDTSGSELDFRSSGSHSFYQMVSTTFIRALPPRIQFLFATQLEGSVELSKIRRLDSDVKSTSSTLLRSQVIHFFEMDITQDTEEINRLDINWRGKATNEQEVAIYYWQPLSIGLGGYWVKGFTDSSSGESNGAFITLSEKTAEDLFITDENTVVFAIATQATIGQTCTLQTDYVNITLHGKGYQEEGSILSKTINPSNLYRWERFAFKEYTPSGTFITYHFTDTSGTLIDDSIINGNEDGFTSSQTLHEISTTSVEKFKLLAKFSTNDALKTPKLYQWYVLWQPEQNTWQDQFSSTLRISSQEDVTVSGGSVGIASSLSDWKMVHQNPANTRSAESDGPQNSDLYWYSSSQYPSGGQRKTPVIYDEKLYVVSKDGRTLFEYDIMVDDDDVGMSSTPSNSVQLPQLTTNTPLVTNDYVIVATGNTSTDGKHNKVVAYHRDTLEIAWEFPQENSIVCFSSSPILANDHIYLTSWSGKESLTDPLAEGNKNVYAIDLSGALVWQQGLPAGSLSTPAANEDLLVVGCSNGDNDSLLAYDANTGEELWRASVGNIGYSSPVLGNDHSYVITKKTQLLQTRAHLVAVSTSDGSVEWNVSISKPMLATLQLSMTTPTVNNGIVYATSPDGTVIAVDEVDGSEEWSTSIWTKPLASNQVFTASPVYANNRVYVGTPDSQFYCLRSSSGESDWIYEEVDNDASLLSSASIANGLLFFSDEQGILYVLGEPETTEYQTRTGTLISQPIYLPSGYSWNQFNATYSTTNDGNISFQLLDNTLSILDDELLIGENISSIAAGETSVRLKALFTVENTTDDVDLPMWKINFSGSTDVFKPLFFSDSFSPEEGWITSNTPVCSIQVRDNGSGLLVNSAEYILEYEDDQGTQTVEGSALCTGTNGTTQKQTISIDLSSVSFSEDILDLNDIRFRISDRSGNMNTSNTYEFTIDNEPPTSELINLSDIPSCITSPIQFDATASDDLSGVHEVGLFYRYEENTEWEEYSSDDSAPYRFTFNDLSGQYEFTTIASDVAGNTQALPDEGQLTILYDNNRPDVPTFDDVYWFSNQPEISVVFTDDYLLDTIWYRPEAEPEWTILASDIQQQTYSIDFEPSQEIWENLNEGTESVIYFRINDTCGNLRNIITADEALIIAKDGTAPQLSIDLSDVKGMWQWDNTFNITITGSDTSGALSGSGLASLDLMWRYSSDNESWNSWESVNITADQLPYDWEFTAEEGDGFYEFKLTGTDQAGNQQSIQEITTISTFPMIPFIVLFGLFMLLLILVIALIMKWRKPVPQQAKNFNK